MMNDDMREYLSEIGRKGGKKSRRQLSSQAAKDMVRVREARKIYRKFFAQCFWAFDPQLKIAVNEIPWIVAQLKKNGNRSAWEAAERLCR